MPERESAHLTGEILDDLMRRTIEALIARGERIDSSKGPNIELRGVLLELHDPRARLSATETRGRLFSALGELCWYLAGSNSLEFIRYYLKHYADYADGDHIYGGYGPRLFNWRGLDQVSNILNLMRRRPNTRQAVIWLFEGADIAAAYKDVPCTCTLQFFLRDRRLHLITHMRSNDVTWGLPHDVFAFTMFQEILARALDIDVGSYKHSVGSLHLYEDKRQEAQQFLDEGWQATDTRMPPMPLGDPWPAIRSLLSAEEAVRTGRSPDADEVTGLDPYWKDLVCLLQVYRAARDRDPDTVVALRGQLVAHAVYQPYVNRQLQLARTRPDAAS